MNIVIFILHTCALAALYNAAIPKTTVHSPLLPAAAASPFVQGFASETSALDGAQCAAAVSASASGKQDTRKAISNLLICIFAFDTSVFVHIYIQCIYTFLSIYIYIYMAASKLKG